MTLALTRNVSEYAMWGPTRGRSIHYIFYICTSCVSFLHFTFDYSPPAFYHSPLTRNRWPFYPIPIPIVYHTLSHSYLFGPTLAFRWFPFGSLVALCCSLGVPSVYFWLLGSSLEQKLAVSNSLNISSIHRPCSWATKTLLFS